MQNNSQWQLVTVKLYKAILIYVGCSIAVALFDAIGGGSDMASFASEGLNGSMSWGAWDILGAVATVGIVYGYFMFYQTLGEWKNIVDSNDVKAVGQLRTAALLTILAAIFNLFAGLVGSILSIIAFVMTLLAYSALKQSSTMPEMARNGARKLYTSQIICIVAVVVGIIPIIGWIAKPILMIVSFFMMLGGWKSISQS